MSIRNALGGIAFVGVGSLVALGLNQVTDEWFACIAFVALWCFVLVRIVACIATSHVQMAPRPDREWLAMAFFAAMYAYCFAGLASLGIFAVHPWFLTLGVALLVGTVALGLVILRRKS